MCIDFSGTEDKLYWSFSMTEITLLNLHMSLSRPLLMCMPRTDKDYAPANTDPNLQKGEVNHSAHYMENLEIAQ
jgi:hypothetical protein